LRGLCIYNHQISSELFGGLEKCPYLCHKIIINQQLENKTNMDFFKTFGKGITQGFEQFITNDLASYIPLFIIAAVLIIAVLIRNWFQKNKQSDN
jgi:hypothetical protein